MWEVGVLDILSNSNIDVNWSSIKCENTIEEFGFEIFAIVPMKSMDSCVVTQCSS
jgi:hypothetical protein